jgi:hypothetical protein
MPKKPTELFVVIQEGGSTGELYTHAFDNLPDANGYIARCDEASYRTSGPIPLPDVLTKALLKTPGAELEFYSFLQTALREATDLS